MKPIGNIAKYLDLRKPASQEDIRKALARAMQTNDPRASAKWQGQGTGWSSCAPMRSHWRVGRACARCLIS
jgi:hypothetical protein